ncbi:hypothetical protein HPB51_000293 [Rhipicephalus microplus]|uniref:Uncharacterized protein n=1 Tax=Rhipicephalus microplus TaxID=6941 RepID=A0A9J6DYF6_RHIMP|nr:hypothetical protein HPB51_000293 [Rhipicephalus microplus]
MRDGSDWVENFGGGGFARGGWRSNRMARRGLRGSRQAYRFCQWRTPLRGVRPPLLPTPWPAFRYPRPPGFANVRCNRWQSPAPWRYLCTFSQYGASASQPRDKCIGESDDVNVAQCDESPSLSKPTARPLDGPQEVVEARVVADSRRRRSPKRCYDRDRPCNDPNASGASDELRDCPEPNENFPSPATSEQQRSTTSPFTFHSPSTSRSKDWSEDTSGALKTSRDSNERRSPSSRWCSWSTASNRETTTIGLAAIESGSSGDRALAKRRRERSTSSDPEKNSKRHKPGCRAEMFRSRREEKSSSASSQVPPPRHIKRSDEMTTEVSDLAKRKAWASSGAVKAESSRASVAKVSTLTKPQCRDQPLTRAPISFISPELAKYKIPKLCTKEQPSSAQSMTFHLNPPRPLLRVRVPWIPSCPEVRIRIRKNPEPVLLVVEEERVHSSPDSYVFALSVAVADSTTSPNSGKAVGEGDRYDVANDATECEDDRTNDLSQGPPSPDANPVTAERSLSPTVAAFEEVEDKSCDDASDGTERQCEYDAETSASGPRPVTDTGAGQLSNMSPAESVCPETAPRSPSDKEGVAVSTPLERPLVYDCDLLMECDQCAESCDDDTLSEATEVYKCDQSSSSSIVTPQSEDAVVGVEPSRSLSVPSGSATELSDFIIVSEEYIEKDVSPDNAAVNSSVSEAPFRGDESTRVTPQATPAPGATSTPPMTEARLLRYSDSFATSNCERVTISSGVSASATGVNADKSESDRPVPENVQRCETVTGRAYPVSDAVTSSTTSLMPAEVPEWIVAEEVVSEDVPSTTSPEFPALVHGAVGMPPGMPPFRASMYEGKTAQSPEAADVWHQFPVVDGPDGTRGALFELLTITSLHVLNAIEDYSTRDLVIRLYLEGRHSDLMEAYGERIRTLVQAAVERQSESGKDGIGVLRRLATLEWMFPQPGSCAGARVRELYELEKSKSQL